MSSASCFALERASRRPADNWSARTPAPCQVPSAWTVGCELVRRCIILWGPASRKRIGFKRTRGHPWQAVSLHPGECRGRIHALQRNRNSPAPLVVRIFPLNCPRARIARARVACDISGARLCLAVRTRRKSQKGQKKTSGRTHLTRGLATEAAVLPH